MSSISTEDSASDKSDISSVKATPLKRRRIDPCNSPDISGSGSGDPTMDYEQDNNLETSSTNLMQENNNENVHDSDSDSDDENESGNTDASRLKSYRPTCNFIEKYTFPVIVEDRGRDHTNQEKLSDYEFDLNRLFSMNQVGKVRATRRVAPGKYLIDCQSQPQRLSLINKASLRTPAGGYIAVQCKIPLPVTEGVIGPINPNVPMETIEEKIKDHNDKVPKMKISKFSRIKKYDKTQNTTTDTAFLHLTFDCHSLPQSIYLGTTLYGVDTFRREPILCGKCHLLGHTKNKCRSKVALCGKCLKDKHPCGEKECPSPKSEWSCRNCKKKGHSAAWPRCPKKLIMKKALEIQASSYMPLAAAVALVTGEKHNEKKKKPNSVDTNQSKTSFSNSFPNLSRKHTNIHPLQKNTQELSNSQTTRSVSEDFDRSKYESTVTQASSLISETNPQPVGLSGNGSTSLKNSLQPSSNTTQFNSEVMQKHLDSVLDKMQKETNKKINEILNKVDAIQKQKSQQLKLVEDFVKINKQKANPTEKITLDIIDAFREAAEGNPNNLFELAKKVSGSGHDVCDSLKADITVLTQNINF